MSPSTDCMIAQILIEVWGGWEGQPGWQEGSSTHHPHPVVTWKDRLCHWWWQDLWDHVRSKGCWTLPFHYSPAAEGRAGATWDMALGYYLHP